MHKYAFCQFPNCCWITAIAMCRFDFHTCFFFVYVVDSGKKSDRVILINSSLIVSSSRSARALFKFSSYGQFGNAMKHAVRESFKLIKKSA